MATQGSRLLLWITALGLVIVAAVAVAVVLLLDAKPPGLSTEPQWLHAKVSGSLSDAPTSGSMLADPSDMPPLTTELTAAIRHAATDEAVEGLLLEVRPADVGWAQLQEIRSALQDFQDAGKPCMAWADAFSNKEYYLATACGEVHAPPTAITLVNGLSVTRSYYAEAFERYGVSANFEHVGDFKTAVEPYERTGPSEAAQEASGAMLDSLYGQLISGIADGRRVTVEKAQGWLDDPPLTAQAAFDRGMLDGLSYREDVTESLIEGDLLTMGSYLQDLRREWNRGTARIAVLHAEGAIVGGSSDQDVFGSAYVGDRTLVRQLKEIREDEDIAAVVLRVNSPGGSGSASDAIWNAVRLTREEKPVVVSMGDYAASGGYYISMGSDWIVAEPGTLTGSIGVFGGKLNFAGALEEFGIYSHTEQRGPYASMLSSMSDFDEQERAKFREFLSGFYDVFVAKAAEGRSMTPEELHAVAQGRVWTGEQALERGLVDELGGLEVALAKARELAELESDAGIVRYPERKSFVDQLLEELAGQGEAAAASQLLSSTRPELGLSASARETLGDLEALNRSLDGGVAALVPGALRVE